MTTTSRDRRPAGAGGGGSCGIAKVDWSLMTAPRGRGRSLHSRTSASKRLGSSRQRVRQERERARVPVTDRHVAGVEQLERVLGADGRQLLGDRDRPVVQVVLVL